MYLYDFFSLFLGVQSATHRWIPQVTKHPVYIFMHIVARVANESAFRESTRRLVSTRPDSSCERDKGA